MGTYVGRHRRTTSRRRVAAYAAVPVVGAASIALAAPANAASGSTWDRLAQCESGGDWSINTGNGYYGGVQFSLSSWRAVGGKGYPHQNSRSEQIYRAERLLDLQGWGAWPTCSRKLGLTNADKGGSPGVSTSSRSSSKSSSSKASSSSSSNKSTSKKATSTKSTSKKAAKATKKAVRQTKSVRSARGSYTVRPGDTLSRIAFRKGVDGGWRALYAANRGVVGGNPNLIFPGQVLRVV